MTCVCFALLKFGLDEKLHLLISSFCFVATANIKKTPNNIRVANNRKLREINIVYEAAQKSNGKTRAIVVLIEKERKHRRRLNLMYKFHFFGCCALDEMPIK